MVTSPLSPSPRRFLSLMQPNTHLSIFSLLCLFFLFSLSIFLYRKKKKNPTKPISSHLSIFPFSISPSLKRHHQDPSKPLFVQILTSHHSPKCTDSNEANNEAGDGSAENRPCANGSEPDLDGDAVEEEFGKGYRSSPPTIPPNARIPMKLTTKQVMGRQRIVPVQMGRSRIWTGMLLRRSSVGGGGEGGAEGEEEEEAAESQGRG